MKLCLSVYCHEIERDSKEVRFLCVMQINNTRISVKASKGAPRKKPSVLASRKFSCAGLFTLNNKKKYSDTTELVKPKVIENGIDLTPVPFLSRSLPSVDEIRISAGRDTIDPRRIGKAATPWISKLIKSMVLDSGK